MGDFGRYARLTAGLDAPLAVVDLAAFRRNADDLVRRAAGTPIRVASKSVRCRALISAALQRPGFHGVMSYALPEALWLARNGIDDILLGYPTTHRSALRALADDPEAAARITLMIDSPDHLALIKSVTAGELADRRGAVVDAVKQLAPLRIVNSGGTGSLEISSADPVVTEVTAGSGLYGPTLFDKYDVFQPEHATAYALDVVRRPAPRIATLFGGGYVASGPAEKSRLPLPAWPSGLKLLGTEGAGEVQTPVLGSSAEGLHLGDRVWMRYAKAGEMLERFDVLHAIDGDELT